METILINLGYGLMLAALLARDILWLRIMVLTAQGSLATYGWSFGDPNVAVWNSIFVAINTVHHGDAHPSRIVLSVIER